MATRVEAKVNASGGTDIHTFEVPDETPAVNAVPNQPGDSPARRWMNEVRRGNTSQATEPVEYLGHTFYVRRLKFSEITRARLMTSRNGDGALDIVDNDDDLRSFTVGVLSVAVAADPEGRVPCFTLAEAAEFADATDSETIGLVGVLFERAVRLNEALNPSSVRGASIPTSPKSDVAPMNPNGKASTMSISPNGGNGSTRTRSKRVRATSRKS